MKTRLNALSKLVSDEIDLSSLHIDMEELAGINIQLRKEMHNLILSNKADNLVKRYLKQVQAECVLLLDQLFKYKTTPNNSNFEDVCQLLEETLCYMQAHYPNFFNTHAKVPKIYFQKVSKEINNQMYTLNLFLKKKNIDLGLQSAIIETYENFLKKNSCSYEQLAYMLKFQDSLIHLCRDINNKQFNELLTEHLLYYNFNSELYLVWHRTSILKEINEQYNLDKQLETLYAHQKRLLILPEKNNCQYEEIKRSVKNSLLVFIKAEINYASKKQCSPRVMQSYQPFTPGQNYRVKLTISVDVLAFLVRLLIEAKVVEANPRSGLIAFISMHFKTPNTENNLLSTTSINNKYKQVTQTTAQQLRVLLTKMIKKIDEEFGR